MSVPAAKPKEEMQLSTLVAAAALEAIDLVDFRGGRPAQTPGSLEVSSEGNVALRANVSAGPFDPEWTAFFVGIDCQWHLDEPDQVFGDLKIGLRVSYSFKGLSRHPPKELLTTFARQVATHHAWPFLRERARTMSVELGLPPLILPLRHLPQPKKGKRT